MFAVFWVRTAPRAPPKHISSFKAAPAAPFYKSAGNQNKVNIQELPESSAVRAAGLLQPGKMKPCEKLANTRQNIWRQ